MRKLPTLPGRYTSYLLVAVLSLAAGLLAAGGVWLKTRTQWLPPEIVLRPPPATASWCFPDYASSGAELLQAEIRQQLAQARPRRYTRALLERSMATCVARSDSLCTYRLLIVEPQAFSILAIGRGRFEVSNHHTLLTEQGLFYLHPVPKRRAADYRQLLRKRLVP